PGHAGRALPDDRPGPGHRRIDGRQEGRPAERRDLPYQRVDVRRAVGGRGRHRGCADLLPRPVARQHRRALRRHSRKGVLAMSGPKVHALSLFDRNIVRRAVGESFRKLSPRQVAKNPVMFVVEVGSVLTTLILLRDALHPASATTPLWFTGGVTVWLWFTVLFANLAEAVAEGRGKAQADTLRKMRKETTARRLIGGRINGKEEAVPSSSLRKADVVVIEAGQLVPGDGESIEG